MASMPLSFRLAWFYFAFFVYAGAHVAYFPPYLAARGLGPAEIAWVLALPHLVRVFAPAAWGWLADRSGAHRGIVVFSCAVLHEATPMKAGRRYAFLPFFYDETGAAVLEAYKQRIGAPPEPVAG